MLNLLPASTCGFASAAFGETLNETLVAAYHNNPALQAEQARLRATDEGIPQARSGFLPTVNATASRNWSNTESTTLTNILGGINGPARTDNYAVNFSQPLFRGFRTFNAVNQAEATSRAGQQRLRATEQGVLLAAITAHLDVVTTRRIVQLTDKALSLLTQMLIATERRYKESDATKTDVELTRSRRAGVSVALDAARATYAASRARFEEVVGFTPLNLTYPRLPMPLLPKSLPLAIEAAQSENPNIGEAFFRELAAGYAVETIRGESLPEVSLNGGYADTNIVGAGAGRTKIGDVETRVTVPLFEGGLIHSRVRQAKELQQGLQRDLAQVRNQAEQQTISAWSVFKANEKQTEARKTQLRSAEVALNGVRKEEALGLRTITNVLDSQQEVLTVQTGLASTERDLVINAYSLLAAMGRLRIEQLALVDADEVYDPKVHVDEVRHKIWGTTIIKYGDGTEETVNEK